jgi:hypothetical protein
MGRGRHRGRHRKWRAPSGPLVETKAAFAPRVVVRAILAPVFDFLRFCVLGEAA